jgi:MFS family permease
MVGRPSSAVRHGIVRLRRAGQGVQERLPRLPIGPEAAQRTRQLTMEGLVPEAALHATYNFRRGVWNGVIFSLMDALFAPAIVLAWFVSRLGGPNILVGFMSAVLVGGAFLPQMVVASRIQGSSHVMSWYQRAGVLRFLSVALIAVSTVLLAGQPTLLLVVFLVLFTLYSFLGGISTLPWYEMVGKVISPRRRGSFFGLRSFWGGVLSLAAAAPIAAIMSEQLWGLTFPFNFAFIFAIGAIVVALGVYFWSSVREPAATDTAPRVSLGALFKRGIAVYRSDADYRSFIVARFLLAFAALADPFYVVFAKTNLGAPPATVGLYLGALSMASLVSNFFWNPLADRASNRMLMTLTVFAVALVPGTAFIISMFAPMVEDAALFTIFTITFILSGFAVGAARVVNNNMMLTIAPPAERATYVGFLNTVLGFTICVPLIGGVLVDAVGFEMLFLLSLAFAALALIASQRMSRKRPDY